MCVQILVKNELAVNKNLQRVEDQVLKNYQCLTFKNKDGIVKIKT